MGDFALVTNTHSINNDLWEAHIGQIQKYMSETHYIFSDEFDFEADNINFISYDPDLKFRSQYLDCIQWVDEEFCLYLNEDYLLYDEPDIEKIQEYVDVMKGDESLSFVRLTRGPNFLDKMHDNSDTLYYADPEGEYFFSQTASLWRTLDLQEIHDEGPDLHIAGNVMSEQFEVVASETCRDLGTQGLVHFSGESKRGMHHYDSSVFPYVASALVKGKWNMSEYSQELTKLFREYSIDPYTRGIV